MTDTTTGADTAEPYHNPFYDYEFNTPEQLKAPTSSDIKTKRKFLNALTGFVAQGAGDSEISKNELIKQHYQKIDPSITAFKTFEQWKKDGLFVNKGETAFLVWGAPLEPKEGAPVDPENTRKYFPLCFLFSNSQVSAKS